MASTEQILVFGVHQTYIALVRAVFSEDNTSEIITPHQKNYKCCVKTLLINKE